jgi:hypothetical protein
MAKPETSIADQIPELESAAQGTPHWSDCRKDTARNPVLNQAAGQRPGTHKRGVEFKTQKKIVQVEVI